MEHATNIHQFNSPKDENVENCIMVFLKRVGQESQNTRKTYETAIRQFFRTMRNRELSELRKEDLVFQKHQIKRYQTELREKFKTVTVNTKLAALKSCYVELQEYGFDVEPSWFELKRYKVTDKTPYDRLTHEEVIEVIRLVSKTRKGFEKALLLRVAYATAFRREALLNLKWDNIVKINHSWCIETIDKGNKEDVKKISDELYEELMKQKELVGGEKIFLLTPKTVDKMMKYINDKMDFGKRTISLHCFKKSSIDEVSLLTNFDVKAVQRHGNHSSALTTLNEYTKHKELEDMIVVDINRELPIAAFDDMSHEELLNLVKRMDRSTQIKMLQTAGLM